MPQDARAADHACIPLPDFTFQPLTEADPPKERGVYVIRVLARGDSIDHVTERTTSLVKELHWPLVEKKALGRLRRLRAIADCPLIYIGAAGPSPSSTHTLYGRYRDFSGRHTIMLPLWALIHQGWNLEYGWLVTSMAAQKEAELKAIFRAQHAGALPALVSR